MRTHKHNVERRMRSDNIGDWTYWSQRRDKLKRYAKHEALDPSWYTDNIYSNHSLDLEGDVVPDFVKYDNYFLYGAGGRSRNISQINEDNGDDSDQFDDDDIFTVHPKGKSTLLEPHREYRYPKSRSCCFGGGYDTQKPTQLLPKSKSFSTARANANANFAKIREIKNTYDMQQQQQHRHKQQQLHHQQQQQQQEQLQYQNRFDCCSRIRRGNAATDRMMYRRGGSEDIDREMLENDFCYTRKCDRTDRSGRAGGRNTYNIDTYNRMLKADMSRGQSNSDYIKNEWLDLNKNKHMNGDSNGNFCDDECVIDDAVGLSRGDQNAAYTDDYLLLDDTDLSNVYEYNNVYNRRCLTSYDLELDQFIRNNRRHGSHHRHDRANKLMFSGGDSDDLEATAASDDYNFTRPSSMQNKSMLEVKPPSRYDDTSSDSTDVDLDDFNFDFEKYWEDLDKTTSTYDIDMQNNNTYNNHNNNNVCKVKNVNLSRYNNGSVMDHQQLMRNEQTKRRYPIHNKSSNLLDGLLPSASSIVENHRFHQQPHPMSGYMDTDFIHPHTPTFNRFGRKVYPTAGDRSIYNNFYAPPPPLLLPPPPPPPPLPPPHHSLYNNNAISLINNIFSIYKPKKYSPLNCHSQQLGIKPEVCKKMNVPSTIRPLGAPANDFITSLKRPLLVAPSPCVEQPHFKIIPEKTGLKISPLYRFDYDSGENKFKLKSTARPLLFPH